ncbi:MAG: hypothetical protein GY754_39960 [bacterium]|nr:hypothetical protein [bacterium]
MGEYYKIEQGDYLHKIARKHGFHNWEPIYDHDKNKDFKKKYPDPNIIYPGEKLYIPSKDELEKKEKDCKPGNKYRYKKKSKENAKLKLDLLAGGIEEKIVKYEITFIGKGNEKRTIERPGGGDGGDKKKKFEGNLEKGELVEEILDGERDAFLKVWTKEESTEPDFEYELKIGHLDPLDTISGIQARLNNLGYDSGRIDGIKGPITEAAVKEFQEDYDLTVDGIPGKKTQGELKDIYNC